MFTHTPRSFARLGLLSAGYDLAVTWPLMTPLTLGWLYALIGTLHGSLGLPAPMPLDVHGTMFANFAGSVVVIWSLARLVVRDQRLTRFDAGARWLFSAWMLTALLNGASPVLWVMLVIEAGMAVAQSLPLKR